MADLIIADELLAEVGLTPEDVRRLCPDVVEHTALDGGPCWSRADLAERRDYLDRGVPR